MRHLFALSLLASLLLLYNYSNAQDVKMKNKAHKTKVKEKTGNTATDNNVSGAANSMSTSAATTSLRNTTWKSYVGEPINDTVTWRYGTDSSSVHSKTGEPLVSGVYTVSGDTLIFHDVSGMHACPSTMIAKYKLTMNGDSMKLDLIEDECEGRAAAIKGIKLQRVKENTSQ